ncbi:MAG TPA: ribosomal protein S18-alanine N-acetyltransferase [Lactobacillaceae bacterium]|jgi:ribosomal-protein-alanine N-acetyltransferase
MDIETATTTDLPVILALATRAFGGESPWPLTSFAHALESPRGAIFVVRASDEMAGFVVVTQMFDELEIDLLAVAPDFQRRGVAQLLLAYVQKLPQVARLLLEVAADNPQAIALYEKFGFDTYAVRKNYYQKRGVDALMMEKTL